MHMYTLKNSECTSIGMSGQESTVYAYLTSGDNRETGKILFHPDTTYNFHIYVYICVFIHIDFAVSQNRMIVSYFELVARAVFDRVTVGVVIY